MTQDTQTAAPGVSVEIDGDLPLSIRRLIVDACVTAWKAGRAFEAKTDDWLQLDSAKLEAESALRTALLAGAAAEEPGKNLHPTIATVCNYETEGPIQYFQLAGGDPLPAGTKLYTAPPVPVGELQGVSEKEVGTMQFDLGLPGKHWGVPVRRALTSFLAARASTPPTAQAPAITAIRQDGEPS